MTEESTPAKTGFSDGLGQTHDRAAFERLVMELTGRDMAYHERNGTTGLAVSWISYRAGVAAERERMCVAIKAADDTASAGDYMLDSDDCISVIRGTWAFEA